MNLPPPDKQIATDINDVQLNSANIQRRVLEVSQEISAKHQGHDMVFVCILIGGISWFYDIVKHVNVKSQVWEMINVNIDRNSINNEVTFLSNQLKFDIQGKHIIIFDNGIMTGKTLVETINFLKSQGAVEVEICLLTKPDRPFDVRIDYVGFTLQADCAGIIGYGIDDKRNGLHRELNNVYWN